MPRRIVVANYVSIDGVIEDPVGMEGSGLGNWIGPFARGPLGDAFKHQELLESGAVLLGRTTYDSFAAVWPNIKDESGFADHLNGMPKFVASNSLKEASWNNTTILSGNVLEEVRSLKEQQGRDILVYGSAKLVHSLAGAGLIDVYNMMVFPVVLGRGARLFAEGQTDRFRLNAAQQFGDGIMLLQYARS